MKFAILPARGGSKRIPRKNVRMFHGRPMIYWTITAAVESSAFERIVVSTDDEEIAQVARECGAEIPFMRSAELSDDHTGTREVIIDALERLGAEKDDIAACLYATAPFISPIDLREAVKEIEKNNERFIYSISAFSYPIQRALRIRDDDYTEMMWPEHFSSRSQDLEKAYHDAGQFYIAARKTWETRVDTFKGGVPVVLDPSRVQDIDTEEDWAAAEMKMKLLHKRAR